jgi:hypothetical protein
MRFAWLFGAASYVAIGVVLAAGCSSSKGENGFSAADGGGSSGDGAVPIGDGSTSDVHFGTGDGGGPSPCVPDPGNFEVPSNNCDDDADGMVDNVPTCDDGLLVNGTAADFVKALGLCQTSTGANDPKWGVVSASYTKGHGYDGTQPPADGQHGILAKFGGAIKPRQGKSFGVISSGFAREYDDAQGQSTVFKGGVAMQNAINPTSNGAPPNFPKPAGVCIPANDVYDVIDLKLQIKVPKNAQGFSFDFDFWSGEWPEYVCTQFNDAFVAYLHSTAFNGNAADNISYDGNHNPVSVNNDFFQACTNSVQTGCQDTHTGTSKCPLMETELAGTGFSDPGQYCNNQQSSGGGATSWLTTAAPVAPGEIISLEFIIWDTHDANYDSSVILDNFKWAPGPVTPGTVRPPK